MKEKFEEQFNCTNIPKQVIDFYNEHDEMNLKINEIFSFEQIVKEYNEYFPEFLSGGMKYDPSAQYIPIASDGMGGYYVFIGNKEDENIYYFDHECPTEDPEKSSIAEILELDNQLDN